MDWHLAVVLVGALVTDSQAFAHMLAIKAGELGLATFPEGFPANFRGATQPQKLTISDQPDAIPPSRIPYFSAKPDQTITWDDMDWCLEAVGGKPGDMVQVNHCTGSAEQKWNWIPNGQGSNLLQLKGTAMCLDIGGNAGGLNGAPVELRGCDKTEIDSWKFEDPSIVITSTKAVKPSLSMLHAMISAAALTVVGMLGLSAGLWHRQKHARAVAMSLRSLPVNVEPGVSMATQSAPNFNHVSLMPLVPRLVPAAMVVSVDPEQETKTQASVTYAVGQQLHGWTCARAQYFKEISCMGYFFEHDKTGAELISMVQPAEENKTFGVVFRTPLENSNGVAHVLEHSVLCGGSRKYPVKDLFAELMKGSLQTFMNAWSGPDYTAYPVASCNLKDFYNLVDGYLDAVFHPRAVNDPRVLAQEGWHYEIEKETDPLEYKGVVFNEMKGKYSDPDYVHQKLADKALFPDNQYGVDCAGDPKVIPSLTFDYFKDFHSKYYHPSNAKFWFYGDDPADARLELLDKYLSEFNKIEVKSSISVQPLFDEPKRVVGEFVVGEDEDISKKIMASVNWVLSDGSDDAQTVFALQCLNHLLMGSSDAPLRKVLIDSGLGSSVIGGGLRVLLQPTFGVGLKDLRAGDVSKVEELVMNRLTSFANADFEEAAIRAARNTIECQTRELNTGSYEFNIGSARKGLDLFLRTSESWLYDKDPFEALDFVELKAQLLNRLEKGEPVFAQLIKDKFLSNSHRVVVESRPNKELGKQIDAEERAELDAHKATLSESDIADLVKETSLLKEIQEMPSSAEAMKTVPRLELSDIPKEEPKIPLEIRGSAPATLLHAMPTSGVVHTHIAFDLSKVPQDLLPLVPFFTIIVQSLRTGDEDIAFKFDFSVSTLCMNKIGSSEPVAYLVMRGESMANELQDLVSLMQESALGIRLKADLDIKDSLVQIASEARSETGSGIVSSGHEVASAELAAQTTPAGWLRACWSELTQYEYLTNLMEEMDASWETVHHRLVSLQSCIFTQAACTVVNITSDDDNLEPAQTAFESFVSSLPTKMSSESTPLKPDLRRRAQGIIIPTQVNYVGKGGNLYDLSKYKFHGSAFVISKLLNTMYLWDRVRASGGAYDVVCRFDSRSGDFQYVSYRDPNLGKTLDTYDCAAAFLKQIEIGEDELTKAIIACIGDLDAYMLPVAKGYQSMLRYLLEEDDEYRQRIRDEILSTTVEDFRNFAESLEAVAEKGGICIVGSREACEQAQEEYGLTLFSPFAARNAPSASDEVVDQWGQIEIMEYLRHVIVSLQGQPDLQRRRDMVASAWGKIEMHVPPDMHHALLEMINDPLDTPPPSPP